MKNERHVPSWAGTSPLLSPPVQLIIEDRDHLALDRVTLCNREVCEALHSHWCYPRWLWSVHSKVTLVLSLASYHMLHTLTGCHQGSRRVAVIHSRLRLFTPIGCCLEEWAWFLLSSPPVVSLGWTVGTEERHVHKPLPAPCTQATPASVMAGAAHWHLPNCCCMPLSQTALPCLLRRQTDRLSWKQIVVNTPSHQQDKVEEAAKHMSQGKPWFNIYLMSLSHKLEMLNVDLESLR